MFVARSLGLKLPISVINELEVSRRRLETFEVCHPIIAIMSEPPTPVRSRVIGDPGCIVEMYI